MICHRIIETKCLLQSKSNATNANVSDEKQNCEKIGFMTKGDGNENNDFQILSSFSKPLKSISHAHMKKENLITNTSIIRYVGIWAPGHELFSHQIWFIP